MLGGRSTFRSAPSADLGDGVGERTTPTPSLPQYSVRRHQKSEKFFVAVRKESILEGFKDSFPVTHHLCPKESRVKLLVIRYTDLVKTFPPSVSALATPGPKARRGALRTGELERPLLP